MNAEMIAEIIDVNTRSLWSVSLGGSNRGLQCYERMKDVAVGDLVVETSAAGMGAPAISRVGYLREVFKGEDGWTHYMIEKLDGKIIDWSNCSFIKVLTEFEYFR